MSVIDTSVYIALINTEETGHEATKQWFQSALRNGEHLFAPVILLAEVGAAVSRGMNDLVLAKEAVELIRQLSILELIPVDGPLAELAASIAIDCRIRGCDALFVALAQQRNEPLVTLDRQQRERGQAVVTVIEPA